MIGPRFALFSFFSPKGAKELAKDAPAEIAEFSMLQLNFELCVTLC